MNHKQFLTPRGSSFRFSNYDPEFTANLTEEKAMAQRAELTEELAKYQDILLAHESRAVLIIFQGMDGAGKDDVIKHVMSSLDPQACKANNFSEPTEEEYKHDYLYRYVKALPESGQIGIFNRSYYEQLTTERVHTEKAELWRLQSDSKINSRLFWRKRFAEINSFEQYLANNGFLILKFFLHISKSKQRERLIERTELPEKKWKFSTTDIEDRKLWNRYAKVYEDAISRTDTVRARWHVIPANHRWFARAAVASVTLTALKSLHKRYPLMDAEQKQNLEKAQRILKKKRKS
jgi:PPK2 family polyphosphate:nucleotide phosphotransferase